MPPATIAAASRPPRAAARPGPARNAVDQRVRRLVRLAGRMVGQTIAAHEGQAAYRTVERLRRGFIAARDLADSSLLAGLDAEIAALPADMMAIVIRGFIMYFAVVNIAEQVVRDDARHRFRGFRWPRSFDDIIGEIHAAGVPYDRLAANLATLRLTPVLTAHPTEARRRTVQNAHRRLFDLMHRLAAGAHDRPDQVEAIDVLREEIDVLWKTSAVRTTRPTVADEISNGLVFFRLSLFEALPRVARDLEAAVRRVYGAAARTFTAPPAIRFGSWIGADRDGNPNVTPETTVTAARRQGREVLLEYAHRIDDLRDRLTQSMPYVRITPALAESLARDSFLTAEVFAGRPTLFAAEPYRRKLSIIRHRIMERMRWIERRMENGTEPLPPAAYATPQALVDELNLIRDDLIANRGHRAARGKLDGFIRLVESFGFHLAGLDVRQEAGRHATAVAEVVRLLRPGTPDYASLDEESRLELLETLIAAPALAPVTDMRPSPEVADVVATFQAIAMIQAEFGARAVETYVVSMTRRPSAVMEVLLLARLGGLVGRRPDGSWHASLRIAPLFETIEDLANAPAVITALLDRPVYRGLLNASGGTQEIMLGYSDSCKDGGILASASALNTAQIALGRVLLERQVPYLFFHGRGGTHARGGGPIHDAILAQPRPATVNMLKFTEQGEVLSFKYSNAATATYELTVALSGLIKATAPLAPAKQADEQAKWLIAMDNIAHTGEAAYRVLVADDSGLLDLFYEVTPVGELAHLNIGSRPAHRPGAARTLASIRAIPWVFGWSQIRLALPAAYGIGSALGAFIDAAPENLLLLQEMHRRWPFFRHFIANAEMVLAKCSLPVAQRYFGLATDQVRAKRLFDIVAKELGVTEAMLCRITGATAILDDSPELELSLRRRAPYIDAVNALQIRLLTRVREAEAKHDPSRDAWHHALLLSINAITAGMRNTG